MSNFTINICGKEKVHIPTAGCSDCDWLEIEVEELRAAIEALANSKLGISDVIAGDNITITNNGNGTITIGTTASGVGYFVGVEDVTIGQGTQINLYEDVIARDSNGQQVDFTVVPGEIDTCIVGETYVAYVAENTTAIRKITITAVSNPTISGTSTTLTVTAGTNFDPMTGVSAEDGNGNDITSMVSVELISPF